jgi:hypothetical protein
LSGKPGKVREIHNGEKVATLNDDMSRRFCLKYCKIKMVVIANTYLYSEA